MCSCQTAKHMSDIEFYIFKSQTYKSKIFSGLEVENLISHDIGKDFLSEVLHPRLIRNLIITN